MTIKDKGIDTWFMFLRTHGVLVRLFEAQMQAEQNMPLTWYDVLVQLSRGPARGMRLQDLAEAIVLSRSGLTRVLDKMESEGLLERKPCHSDRRGMYAVLTPKGQALVEDITPLHLLRVKEHFLSCLTDEEIRVMQQAFSKILLVHTKEEQV